MTANLARGAEPYHEYLSVRGHDLEGREIVLRFEGEWYDAIVVRYYPVEDEYKVVYRADDGVEVTALSRRQWALAPRKTLEDHTLILDGCTLEFVYPADQKTYRAMVYDYNATGSCLKIAYSEEHSTDCIKGGGWIFLTESPCVADGVCQNLVSNERVAGVTELENRSEQGSLGRPNRFPHLFPPLQPAILAPVERAIQPVYNPESNLLPVNVQPTETFPIPSNEPLTANQTQSATPTDHGNESAPSQSRPYARWVRRRGVAKRVSTRNRPSSQLSFTNPIEHSVASPSKVTRQRQQILASNNSNT